SEESFRQNPTSAYKGKVIVNDSDHLWGHTGGDNVWVWKSFCRGLNVLFMEELFPSPTWQDSARQGMEETRQYADKINLAAMVPSDNLSETTYCLADKGKEYLVFQAGDRGEFTVNLNDTPGTFSVEWFSVNDVTAKAGKTEKKIGKRNFTTPIGSSAAHYRKSLK